MKTSQTVLHLSVMLAMTLSAVNGVVYASDDLPDLNGAEATQQHRFQNPDKNTQLRHRVGERDIEQAQRNRLQLGDESQSDETVADQPENGDQESIVTPSHDRDRIRDRDNIHKDDATFEQTQKRQRVNQSTQQLTENEEAFDVRFNSNDRASGQGFNTSGSIVRSKNNSSSGNGSASMGGSTQVIKGGAGHGSGGGNGRR
ncbi:MAG: hypothetical protein ABW139_12210 [Candidatus Thiodiazotropha sp. DIVDIV]